MKLDISERLTLVNVIPQKGNFETLKTVESLKDKLYPSEDETKKFNIETNGNTVTWNKEGFEPVEIKLTEGQVELLVKSLEELNGKEELTYPQYLAYKKFKKPEEKEGSKEK
jgi:hypothetical protein